MKPLHSWVQIEPEEAKTSQGGIIVETEEGKRNEVATILALGNKLETGIKVGDRILFKGYAVDELVLDKKKLFFLKESEIIAVL